MQDKIESIFIYFENHDPHPRTELNFINEYSLLVSIVLSAQATDKSVNKATNPLFLIVQTPEDMISIGEDNLKEYIRSIGLYNSKAKNIINLSRILIEKYGSKIPNDYKSLKALPGVGSKTAKVFLNCVYSMPLIAVDTHVLRVSNRLGLINEKDPTKASILLESIIPKKWLLNAHHWIILHGRYVCKSRNPDCDNCGVKNYCEFYQNQNNI